MLSRTRFGNRYYENLNAEEEIPGGVVSGSFALRLSTPLTPILRPSPMGRSCSGEMARVSGRLAYLAPMCRRTARWLTVFLALTSTNTTPAKCPPSGIRGSHISAMIHRTRTRLYRNIRHPGNRSEFPSAEPGAYLLTQTRSHIWRT